MNLRPVRVVRIFLTERSGEAEQLLRRLREEWKVHGVTVYRAVAGFGDTGRMHTARVLDVSHDLPLAIEFYDSPDRIDEILGDLHGVKAGHLVTWMADMWMGEKE